MKRLNLGSCVPHKHNQNAAQLYLDLFHRMQSRVSNTMILQGDVLLTLLFPEYARDADELTIGFSDKLDFKIAESWLTSLCTSFIKITLPQA